MSIKELQKQVDDWVQQYKVPYWQPLSILARVTEEVGELAQELNDRYGGRVKKEGEDYEDIGVEIADILFALICLANSHNINLDESWEKVIDKCYGRDKDRYERKEPIEQKPTSQPENSTEQISEPSEFEQPFETNEPSTNYDLEPPIESESPKESPFTSSEQPPEEKKQPEKGFYY